MTAVAPRSSTVARDIPGAETLGGAIRLFFRFPTPRLLLGSGLGYAAARLALGGLTVWDVAILLAVAAYWPLQEWVLHAYILHLRPRKVLGVMVDPVFAKFHRYHHAHPWVLERTFLPTQVLLPLMPVNVLLFWAVMPTLGLAVTAMGAMTAVTLVYEWTHYLTHTPYRPRSRYYRKIQQNHMRHHFQDDQRYFAFTGPWLDDVFGTGDKPSP